MLGEVRGDQPQAVGVPALVEHGFITAYAREGRAVQLLVEPVAQILAVGEAVVLGEIPGAASDAAARSEVLEALVGVSPSSPARFRGSWSVAR